MSEGTNSTPRPFDPDGAAVGPGIYGLPHTPEEARVVLLPVPWEATVSYHTGTARGPEAILQASRQVDLYDLETGRPWEAGIACLPMPDEILAWSTGARRLSAPVIAAGGVERPRPSLVPTPPSEDRDPREDLTSPPPLPVDGSLTEAEDHLRRAEAVDRLSEQMHAWVGRSAAAWLDRDKLLGLIGGDHSVSFPLIRELAPRHPRMGLLQFDAHADLRPAYEGFRWSHASIMWNVLQAVPLGGPIVQVGVRDLGAGEARLIEESGGRIRTWFDPEIRARLQSGQPWNGIVTEVVEALPPEVYVSFDIDGLDPSLCPNTGTPVPGGLSFPEATSILRAVAHSGRQIVGFDLVEVAPDPRGDSEWDANVGARLLYKLIGFALQSQNR